MTRQLTLDGREVERPPRRTPLTDRQREVMRYMRSHEDVSTAEVGAFMRDPCNALRRFERRGLVVHVRRGHWRATKANESWR